MSNDLLFKLSMQQKWAEVVEKYKDKNTHTMKLTKSEDTALHIAISSYNPKSPNPNHENATVGMIKEMKASSSLGEVLRMKNVRGDTALHLAAAVGWEDLCKRIANEGSELIEIRNSNGETPLFIAAHHGNLEAFLALHHAYTEGDCDRKLPEETNTDHGESLRLPGGSDQEQVSTLPIHAQNESLCRRKDGNTILHSSISGEYFGSSRSKKKKGSSTDVENQTYMVHGIPIRESFLADCSRSKKQNAAPHGSKGAEEEQGKYDGSFPPNYTACFSLLKFASTVILTVLGIGFWKITKIKEKKVRHSHAMEILKKMMEFEPSYKYDGDGLKPLHSEAFTNIPATPPPTIAEDFNPDSPQNTPKHDDDHNKSGDKKAKAALKDTPLLVAAKMGIPEMVKKILKEVPIAIQDEDGEGKNVVMLAAENRQTNVFDFLVSANLPDYVFHHVDNEGNSILHLAAKLGEKQPWRIPGAALQMQWEIKWYKHVKSSVPSLCFSHHNTKGETPRKMFTQTHENLVKSGNEWLIKTSESCSVVAALIATVAFATSATVPGGLDQSHGYPILKDRNAFDIFSIASLIALCLSITALVFFLAIITSRFEERDFKRDLPRKLLMGLTCLFSGIAAMLLSFCAGHTFILRDKLRIAAVPIYAAATVPVTFFAAGQLPLYLDLLSAALTKVPLRSYKAFHH